MLAKHGRIMKMFRWPNIYLVRESIKKWNLIVSSNKLIKIIKSFHALNKIKALHQLTKNSKHNQKFRLGLVISD